MALSLLKDAWRDHRTACVAAAAAAGALALWAARRRANALHAPSPGGRLLGQAERVVYEYGRQMNGCMMCALRVTIRGPRLEEDELNEALVKLRARHPVLRSAVRDLGGGDGKAKLSTMEIAPSSQLTTPVTTVVRHDDKTWLREWRRLEKRVPQPGDSLAQVVLLRQADASAPQQDTDILLVCNHAFCDGISLSAAAHELLLMLSTRETLPPLELSPTLEDMCKDTIGGGRLFGSIKRLWALLKIPLYWSMPHCTTFPIALEDMPFKDLSVKASTATVYADLAPQATSDLIQAGRARHVTVTAAVAAALLHTLADVCAQAGDARDVDPKTGSPYPVLLHCGADTRRRYREPLATHHMSYHVTGIPPYAHRGATSSNDDADSMWATAAAVRAEWTRGLEARLPLSIGLVLGKMWAAMLTHEDNGGAEFRGTGGTSSISGWGVLPFTPTYGEWTLVDARPSVNMASFRMPVTLVSTTNGLLTVTILAPTPVYAADKLEALRAGLVQRLETMASAASSSPPS